MLGDWDRNALDVGFLECVLTDCPRVDIASNRHHWNPIHNRSRDSGDQVGGAWTAGRKTYSHSAGRSGVPIGHMGRALLVANKHVAYLGPIQHLVVHRQDNAARISKDRVYAFANEGFHDYSRTGSVHYFAPKPAFGP